MANQGSDRASGQGFRWRWLVFGAALLALGLAGVLLMTSEPDQSTEGQVRRLLSQAARQERSGPLSGLAYQLASRLQSYPQLARLLVPGMGGEHVDVAEELEAFGEDAVPLLLDAMAHDHRASARRVAVDALGRIASPAAFSALTNAVFHEPDQSIQNEAIQAVGRYSEPAATQVLLTLMRQPGQAYQRGWIVSQLEQRMDAEVIQALIQLLRGTTNAPAPPLSTGPQALPPGGPASLLAMRSPDEGDGMATAAAALLKTGQPQAVDAALSYVERATNEDTRRLAVQRFSFSDWHPDNPATLQRWLAVMNTDSYVETVANVARLLATSSLPEAHAALTTILRENPASRAREAAARALARVPAERSTSALITALHEDAEGKVRRAAAHALAQQANDASLQALRQALDKEARPEVRAEVLDALRTRGVTEAGPLILEMLNSGQADEETKQSLTESLQHITTPEAQAALITILEQDPSPNLRRAAAGALGHFRGKSAVQALLAALNKETEDPVIFATISALEELHDPQAVEPLCALLASPSRSRWSRQQAATALGRIGDSRALQPLLTALAREREPRMSEALAEALGDLGDLKAIPALLQELKRGNAAVQANAATALGRLRATEAVDALIELAVKRQNKNALAALGAIGDQRALPVLLNAFKSTNPALRSVAAAALGRLGHRDAVTLLAQAFTTEKSDSVRGAIVSALGELGDPHALPALRGALTAKGASYREELAWALGHCGDATVVPDLQTLLDDREERVRFAAAMGLAEIGDAASAQALRVKLTDAEENTRIAAAFALAFLDAKEGMPVLAPNVHSKTLWQRFAAVVAMLRLGTPEAREVLAKGAHDVLPGLAAIARRGQEGQRVEALLPALADPNRDIRQYTARALAFFRDPSAQPALQQAAKDRNEEVRAAAQVTLARLSRL